MASDPKTPRNAAERQFCAIVEEAKRKIFTGPGAIIPPALRKEVLAGIVLRHEVTDEPVCTLADDDYLEKFRNTMIGWPACNALRIWWVDQLRPVSRSHSAIR